MNILITGISSFIGSSLAKQFSDKGFNVYGTYKNLSERNAELSKLYPKLKLIKLDLAESGFENKLPCEINCIIHASALSVTTDHAGIEMVKHNIIGTFNLSNYSQRIGLEKMIYLSSLSIHGIINTPTVNENTGIIKQTLYGYTKYIGEKIVANMLCPSISIRLPGVLGPNSSRAWIPELCKKLKNNETIKIFNPNNFFNNLIDVNSLGDFICSLITNNIPREHYAFPVGASDPIKISEVVYYLKQALDSKSEIIEISSESNSFTIDSSFAIKKLGYQPTTCLEGLSRQVHALNSVRA